MNLVVTWNLFLQHACCHLIPKGAFWIEDCNNRVWYLEKLLKILKKKKKKSKTQKITAINSALWTQQSLHITSQYQQKEEVYSYRANNALAFPSNHCCAPKDTATEPLHCTCSIDFSLISTGRHKKMGTFEKPNKNWRNPRKKIWQKLNH